MARDGAMTVSPKLISISPDRAVRTGGTQVTISGSGFQNQVTVKFAGISATAVQVKSSSQILATVPPYNGPLGFVEVLVQNPDKSQVAASDLYAYVRIPVNFADTLVRGSGNGPSALAVEDVDNDSAKDLIIANAEDKTITVLLNNGPNSQKFVATAPPYATAEEPTSLAVADINGDGVSDIIATHNNPMSQDLSVLRGSSTSKGTFSTPPDYFAVGQTATSVIAKDFSGDGKVDLAVSVRTLNKVFILTNKSSGGATLFNDPPYPGYAVGRDPVALLLADFNGDSQMDLLSANYSENQIGVLLKKNDGTFMTPQLTSVVGEGPIALASGLLTADGIPDVVTANFDGNNITVRQGKGDGTFTFLPSVMTTEKPRAVAIADLDRDGKQDLVAAISGRDQIWVWLGMGDGTFEPPQIFAVGHQPWALAVVDLDGDNHPDVITANQASDDVSILLNRTIQ